MVHKKKRKGGKRKKRKKDDGVLRARRMDLMNRI